MGKHRLRAGKDMPVDEVEKVLAADFYESTDLVKLGLFRSEYTEQEKQMLREIVERLYE